MRLAIAASVALVLSAPAPAHAEGQPVRLAWVRGEGAGPCPDQAAIVARVEERLEGDFVRDDALLSVEGLIERREGWKVHLRVRDAAGEVVGARELASSAAGCGPVAEAATLAIILTIDPTAPLTPPPTPPAPASLPVVAPAPSLEPLAPLLPHLRTPEPSWPPAAPSGPLPTAATDLGPAARLSARGAVAVGILPAAAGGVAVGARGRLAERLWLGLGMTVLPEVEPADPRFAFGAVFGTATGCYDLVQFSRGGVAGCLHAHLGAVRSSVREALPVDPGEDFWAGVGLGGEARIRVVSELYVEVGVEGVVNATPLRYRFLDDRTIYQQPAGGLLARAGLAWGFL